MPSTLILVIAVLIAGLVLCLWILRKK